MKNLRFFIVALAMVFIVSSCKKNDTPVYEEEINTEVLSQIKALGFSSMDVVKCDEGYIVEGDILLTEEALNDLSEDVKLRVGTEEHYRTYNLVSGTPRVITVSLSSKLPSNFGPALDEALNRYNTLGLNISFQRVASNGDINIIEGPKWWNRYGILGMGGFPTADGEPYHKIEMNAGAFRKAQIGYLATVLAHEMGHNIGFRHTDYMDRSYSCGGAYDNEGPSDVGAVHIPGTPVDPERRSWMLSCSDGTDRPFTVNDQAALEYLY
ncbi:M57 family metalloprotease [Carboxylicivirga sp. RSCT41]|uniref:M57 family metalloprotease n=1 Tax=Carboxylicivirga agarovorans TaxID=3417570 RepID=UPI003D32BD1C